MANPQLISSPRGHRHVMHSEEPTDGTPTIEYGIEPPPIKRRLNHAWWREMQINGSAIVGRDQMRRMQTAFANCNWGFRHEKQKDGRYRVWRVVLEQGEQFNAE